jgi:hypothetical protein
MVAPAAALHGLRCSQQTTGQGRATDGSPRPPLRTARRDRQSGLAVIKAAAPTGAPGPLSAVAQRPHVLADWTASPSAIARLGRLVIVGAGVALGLVGFRACLATMAPPYAYTKDFLQEYVIAGAVANGADPYVPIQELAARYVSGWDPGGQVGAAFAHPTPHPPTIGLLFWSISYLDYLTAMSLWFGLGIACLALTIALLARTARARMPLWGTLTLTTVALAWYPVGEELALGQVMISILLLTAVARLALLRGHHVLGGVALGCALLIKPIVWPLLFLLAMRRSWRGLAAAILTALAAYGATAWVVGVQRVVAYMTDVLPAVNAVYKNASWNLSLWTLGRRLFEGTDNSLSMLGRYPAPPLVRSELAATVVSVAVPALVLLVACHWARKRRDLDASFGVFVCVSIMVSPISWGHYGVLAIIPIAQVVAWLLAHRFPTRETNAALVIGMLLFVSFNAWTTLALQLWGRIPTVDEPFVLPSLPSLLLMMPTVAVAALGWLVGALTVKRDGRTCE